MMMKKKFVTFLIILLLTVFGSSAIAEVKNIKLTMLGCASWGAKHRIGSILKDVKGIKNYHFENNDVLVVNYDDKITTSYEIVKTLEKKGEKIRGKSVSSKKN